jgi:hypothetical protein
MNRHDALTTALCDRPDLKLVLRHIGDSHNRLSTQAGTGGKLHTEAIG